MSFLDLLLGALYIPKRRERLSREGLPPLPANAKAKMPGLRAAFERWAARAKLIGDGRGNYRGALGGHVVFVRPGLEGSAPSAVEVELAMEHAAPSMLLTGPAKEDAPAIVRRVSSALFDDPAFVFPIRSVAFAPGLVRIRLAPLTDPAVVEQIVSLTPRLDPSTASPFR